MSIYIIFQDGNIAGHLSDESSAKKAVADLSEKLSREIYSNPIEAGIGVGIVRVFRETTENGVKIYTQALGSYMNGSVVLRHTVEWKSIPEFSLWLDEIT